MTDITYTLEFYSYWHCGSGLSAGADTDALVVKDQDGLPFVPGKTIKGLVSEAVEYIHGVHGCSGENGAFLGEEGTIRSSCFFSNATLVESNLILSSGLADGLFDRIASTSIDETTGTAKDGSLRSLEVVIPCTLTGRVLNVPDEKVELVKKSLAFISGIGLQRNRGLGRCHFSVVKEEKK